MMRNITKQLCVLYKLLTALPALELALPEEEILKPRAFDAISILSVRKRGLFHVIAQALFRQGRHVVVS